MKKICVFMLSLIMCMSAVNVYAWDEKGNITGDAPFEITKDSVLVLKGIDNDFRIQLAPVTGLGYQEIVFPYGTDLSELRFGFNTDGLNFHIDDDVMEAFKIKEEWLPGYAIGFREKIAYKGYIFCSKDGGNYDEMSGWFDCELEEGSTYTITMDGKFITHEKLSVSHEYTYRSFQIKQGCKFAFKVRVAEEGENLNETPKITEGKEISISQGMDEALVIKVDRDFNTFTGVSCDGQMLTKGTDYTVGVGSTIVTLSSDYVKSLSVGTHEIKVIYGDLNSEPAVITVAENATDETTPEETTVAEEETTVASEDDNPTENPPASGEKGLALLWLVFAASVMGIASTFIIRKKLHSR